jgi:hypothetical protein
MTDDAGRSVILANSIEPTDLPPARLVEPIDLVPPTAPPTVTLTRARLSAHRLAAIAVMLLAGAIAIRRRSNRRSGIRLATARSTILQERLAATRRACLTAFGKPFF